MSLNSLKIATSGYLKKGAKAALTIAVAGYLNFGGTPPGPSDDGGGMNGGVVGGSGYGINLINKANKDSQDWEERIKLDDELVFHVIKIFLERCQT